jgi:outer membrane protein insertion porin family
VRADVARIIELYKRQGRFAASVEPKMVMLDQNRVDIVFEISEGPKSKVRQINIIGNEKFSDGELRGQMVTKQSRFFRLFSSGTSYDPDRLAFDQQKLRQFYLTNGYADFRVVSAVAELTPDKRTSSSPTWWRRGSATSSATSRWTASCATSMATSWPSG